MTTVKIPGVPVELNGKKYICPPLNLRALKEYQSRISSFKGGIDEESVQLIIDCALAALKRNYPDITAEEIEDGLDVSNMGDVFQAIMDVSGLKRKESEAEMKLLEKPGVPSP